MREVLTKEQAALLCEAFEIDIYMYDQEEIDMMIESNLELHKAYRVLFFMANPHLPHG